MFFEVCPPLLSSSDDDDDEMMMRRRQESSRHVDESSRRGPAESDHRRGVSLHEGWSRVDPEESRLAGRTSFESFDVSRGRPSVRHNYLYSK